MLCYRSLRTPLLCGPPSACLTPLILPYLVAALPFARLSSRVDYASLLEISHRSWYQIVGYPGDLVFFNSSRHLFPPVDCNEGCLEIMNSTECCQFDKKRSITSEDHTRWSCMLELSTAAKGLISGGAYTSTGIHAAAGVLLRICTQQNQTSTASAPFERV